jgi:hypothetical protein
MSERMAFRFCDPDEPPASPGDMGDGAILVHASLYLYCIALLHTAHHAPENVVRGS